MELTDILGEEAYLLMEEYGGTTIYVPEYGPMRLECLSQEGQDRLRRYAGGAYIYVPRGDIDRKRRNDAIVNSLRSGEQLKVVARKFHVSERHIYNILSNYKPK